MTSRREFLASLPHKRVTAGALIRDRTGRVLLVRSVSKDVWLTPGGSVEADESPRGGARREVREELGVDLTVGRLLVIQWMLEADDEDGVLHFTYDGGAVDETSTPFHLPPEELSDHRFVELGEVAALASPDTALRLGAAVEALATGSLIELE